QQGRRELSCHKSLQILHTLAHANPVNRDRTYALRTGCNGSQRTAFGGTVQLGDNQTSQPQGRIKRSDLGNGVLAGVAVYNQENFMGSLAIGLANHTLDLLELFHQVQLSRQATGSVHHDHTHITSTACMYRIKSHGGGVATILSNNADVIAGAPLNQLFTSSSTEGIAGGQQDFCALLLEGVGQFTDRRGFTCTIHPGNHDNQRLARLQRERFLQGLQVVSQDVAQDLFDLSRITDFFLANTGTQGGNQFLGSLD